MIDTAGTLCQAAETLKQNGASRVFAFASHGLFSGPASDRIKRSSLEEVIVVNTIPSRASAKTNEKIKSVRALRVWAWGWACRRRRRRRRCHRCRRRPASRARLSP
jgi:phosphoribosylpyrophosphate synthetase